MTPLPVYDLPPVSEVAIGVQFAPLERWQAAHGGLYWSLINRDYPRTEMQPPFFTPMEKFGDERLAPQPAFQIVQTGAGLDRYWFLTEDGTRLIQIQKDWFI